MNRVESAVGFADADEIAPLTEQQVRTLQSDLTAELRRLVPGSRAGLMVALAELERGEAFEAAVRDLPIASRRRIRQLLAALGRMAAGSYGVCARCSDRIAFERLEVIPETVWCRRCSSSGALETRPVV